MALKNTASSYGTVAKILHWATVLLLCGMYPIGFIMADMALSPQKIALIGWHKSFGVMVLLLVILRLLWRLSNTAPLLPAHMGKWERLAAHFSHSGLYVLLFLMPISGWMMSSFKGIPVSAFGWFTLPRLIGPDKMLGELLEEVHEFFAWGLLGLIGLHIMAALLHHFYYKDTILVRMLPDVGKKK